MLEVEGHVLWTEEQFPMRHVMRHDCVCIKHAEAIWLSKVVKYIDRPCSDRQAACTHDDGTGNLC